MKITKSLLFVFASAFLSSCVFSLFPIYTAETLVYLPELEGEWQSENTSLRILALQPDNVKLDITVTPGDDEFLVEDGDTIRDKEYIQQYYTNMLQTELQDEMPEFLKEAYIFEYSENEDTTQFKARLAQIGDEYYVDLYPIDGQVDANIVRNLFPVHSFMKLELKSSELMLTEFDMRKLKDLFQSNQIRLRHEDVEGSIIITAQPEEIQKFIQSYSKDQTVFDDPDIFKKVNS